MWLYKQTGQLITPSGAPAAHGFYSGYGPHANVPADEGLMGKGPIPCGDYTMAELLTNTPMGPVAIRLAPDEETFYRIMKLGRDPYSFYIHDDTVAHDETASEGCICSISGTEPVMNIWDSGDHQLKVVAG